MGNVLINLDKSDYVAIKDICELLDISDGTVRKYVKLLNIEVTQGKIMMIKKSDLTKVKQYAEKHIKFYGRKGLYKKDFEINKNNYENKISEESLERKKRWQDLFVPNVMSKELLDKIFDPKWMPKEKDLIPKCFLEDE